jgi:hypothetical protein
MAPAATEPTEKGANAVEKSVKDNPREAGSAATTKAAANIADEEDDEEEDDEDFVRTYICEVNTHVKELTLIFYRRKKKKTMMIQKCECSSMIEFADAS